MLKQEQALVGSYGNNLGIAPCTVVLSECGVVVSAAAPVLLAAADDGEGFFGTPHARDSVPLICARITHWILFWSDLGIAHTNKYTFRNCTNNSSC